MGFFRNWHTISVVISLFLSSIFQTCYGYDPKSLEGFVYDYTNRSLEMPNAGTLYNVNLPDNFTGMKVSFIRLRNGRFRKKGVNLSFFYIPPMVITEPNVKRIAIIYENLGNLSSFYYKVPNYTLVAPVVGFMAYDSPNASALGNRKLILRVKEKSISIRFSDLIKGTNLTPKCVEFDEYGRHEIKNMSGSNYVCFARGHGHFSLVIPSITASKLPKKKEKYWKLWVIGLFGGFSGLILLGLVVLVIIKLVKKYQLRTMENQSEKDVSFDTFWVGRSKMPSASMVRTQPSLELEYVP